MSRWYRPCCTIRRPPSVSVLDRGGTHSPGLNQTPPGLLHMYYTRLCSKKLLSDIRERELCLSSLLSRSRRLSSAVTSPVARPPSSSSRNSTGESLCTWLSCFSSRWQLLATLRANSRDDTVSPFPSFPSALFCPPPSFLFDVSSRKEKNSRSAASRSDSSIRG